MNCAPQAVVEAQIPPYKTCSLDREEEIVERGTYEKINKSTSSGRSKISMLTQDIPVSSLVFSTQKLGLQNPCMMEQGVRTEELNFGIFFKMEHKFSCSH